MTVLIYVKDLFAILKKKPKFFYSYLPKLLSSQAPKLLFLFFTLFPCISIAKFFDITTYHQYGPLSVRSQNPLYLLMMAEELEKTKTLNKGGWSFSLDTSYSNLFEWHPKDTGTGLQLDMELLRLAFEVRYGITNNFEIGVEIPFLNFSGGVLDSFIQGYHDAFGFPNAGRELVEDNSFSYRVSQNGTTLYDVNKKPFGLSDIILKQKLKFFEETKTLPSLSIKTQFKLPTGSRTEGTGSNQVDFSFSLLAQKNYKRLHSYTQIGFLALGGHSDLTPIFRKGGFLFGQAFEFNLFEHLSLVAQISGNTTLFKNVDISELSQPVFDLTIGFTGEARLKGWFKKINYRFGFMEDPLSHGPSTDFTVFLKWGVVY